MATKAASLPTAINIQFIKAPPPRDAAGPGRERRIDRRARA
jgi:hypothetical protein